MENNIKVVSIGIQFDRIGDIDSMNDRYHADLTIEASWEDDKVSNKYVEGVDWSPNIYIENIIKVFWERLEIENFPLDIQELSITVTSSRSKNELRFEEDRSKQYFNSRFANTFVDQQKWKLYEYILIRNYASYDSYIKAISSKYSLENDLPMLCATCFVSRQPGYYYWNAYFLIFLITVSSLNLFSIDCKLPQNRLQNNFLLLLTSISFKWVVNRSMPTVSYLTSLDLYGIANIFFLCLLAAWHSIVGSFWDATLSKFLDQCFLIAFAILFFIIQILLLVRLLVPYYSIKKLKEKEKEYLKSLKSFEFPKQTETSEI